MKFAIVVLLALVLNILGAITAKYLAIDLSISYEDISKLTLLLFFAYALLQGLRLLFWYFVGKIYQLSYLYPALSVNYLFAFVLGVMLFGEQFEVSRLIGSIIIVIGVAIMTFSKSKHEVNR